jgi:uncharacterized protein (TIGR02996 family)
LTKLVDGLTGGTRKANAEAWTALEAKGNAADLARLLAATRASVSPIATTQVAQLAKRKTGAVALGLLGFIKDPPYAGGQSRKFYQAVIAGLAARGDAAIRDEMIELSKFYKPIMNSFLGEWIAGALARTAAKMAPAETKATKPAKPTKPTKPNKQGGLADLFAQIVAAPDDDAPRAVYADALSETNDWRGEFITLQLARAAGTATKKMAEREREILHSGKHENYPTPIATAAEAMTFERGLPVAIMLAKTGLANVIDEVEWGTVRTLHGIDSAPITAVVKLLDSAPNLTHVGRVIGKLLAKLAKPTYAWRSLELDHDGVDLASLAARLPNLRELRLQSRTELPKQLPRLPLEALAFRDEANPTLVTGLALRKLSLRTSVAQAAAWLAAQPSLETLSLADGNAFKAGFDWTELKALLAAKTKLSRLLIKNDPYVARFDRNGTGWSLTLLCSESRKGHGFYTDLATRAKSFKTLALRGATLQPAEPLHYAAAFADATPDQLTKLATAWPELKRVDTFLWPDNIAPQEGWVLNRTNGWPSR